MTKPDVRSTFSKLFSEVSTVVPAFPCVLQPRGARGALGKRFTKPTVQLILSLSMRMLSLRVSRSGNAVQWWSTHLYAKHFVACFNGARMGHGSERDKELWRSVESFFCLLSNDSFPVENAQPVIAHIHVKVNLRINTSK